MLNLFRRGPPARAATQSAVLGTSPAADAIALALRAAGREVACLAEGASLPVQERARTEAIVLAGDDEAANLEQARNIASAHVARGEGTSDWTVLAVIVESQSAITALQDLDSTTGAQRLRVRPLSRRAAMARRLLLQHGFAKLRYGTAPARVAILGTGAFAEQSALELFRIMHLPEQTPQVTVFGPGAAAWAEALAARIPGLARAGALKAQEAEAGSIAALKPSALYVCDAALWGKIAPLPWYLPVYWLDDAQASPAEGGVAVTFPEWRELAATLIAAPADRQAEAIHQIYLEECRQAGEQLGERPSLQLWPFLPERFRAASRHQADHIVHKLATVGCRLSARGTGPRFAFTPAEVERLSEAEHRRWEAVQLLDGWRYGKVRNDAVKETPLLVPYDALTQEVRDLDRLSVRAIPTQIDRVAQSILRDLVVHLACEDASAPGEGFDAGVLALLREIAERYPNRALQLRGALAAPMARRFAGLALERAGAGLILTVETDLPPAPEVLTLAHRAHAILATAPGEPLPQADLALCCGNSARPATGRVIVLEPDGRTSEAPWR